MIASEWYLRGQQANNPIEGFTDFWRGFNHLYSPLTGRTEKSKIKWFLEKNCPETFANQVLGTHSLLVEYLLSQPVIDMRGNGQNTGTNIESFHSAQSFTVQLQEIFMIIYQVRCNLQHGQKSPNSARDIRLCECSGPIVGAVLQMHA